MNIITILLYAIVIFMFFRTMSASKRVKKNKVLIAAMQSIKEEEDFFEKINEVIDSEEGEFKAKAQVIKLWGMAYHQRYAQFANQLDSINIDDLIMQGKNGGISIENDEDSFVYLYLAIPEILYANGRTEERQMLKDKMAPYQDRLSDQVSCALSEAMDRIFENRDDKGLEFCEKLLAGDYGDYSYSKSMIGLYKSIAGAQAAKIYSLRGDSDKYNELLPMLEEFAQSGIGSRWIKGLGLNVNSDQVLEDKEETEEGSEEDENETFDIDSGEDE